MANEIHWPGETGLTVYAQGWRTTDNKVWSSTNSAFETFAVGSWTDYDISLAEIASGARVYEGDWNPGSTAGSFPFVVYKQLGTAPASTDEQVGMGTLLWDGSAETFPETAVETATASASAVTLINMALTWIGVEPITSLTDANERARAASRIYNRTRDWVIAQHRWNSCTKHVALSELSESEVFSDDWAYTFQLPTDFIRFGRPEYLDDPHKIIAGQKLLTNVSDQKIEYIARVDNIAEMDEGLKHAIARRLAADLAITLKGDRALAVDMERKYQDVIAEARFTDSDQHSTTETVGGSTWLQGRISAPGSGWANSV